jgi:hypothetical protein
VVRLVGSGDRPLRVFEDEVGEVRVSPGLEVRCLPEHPSVVAHRPGTVSELDESRPREVVRTRKRLRGFHTS